MQFLGKENSGRPLYGWTEGVPVEDRALQQLKNVAALPFIHHHVAVMPDVHWGIGATVGSVIPTVGAIVPAAVGVDLGCGMLAQKTTIRAEWLPDNLSELRSDIEKSVPHGRTHDGAPGDKGAWGDVPEGICITWGITSGLAERLKPIVERHPGIQKASQRAAHHLGTLGTGNHFIELCIDEAGFVWVMLHSGSRGIGNKIGSYFIERAKKEMERWFISVPDRDLAYLPEGSELFNDYLMGVGWAQDYAYENRNCMMHAVELVLAHHFPEVKFEEVAINCHHNYVSKEHHYGKNVWLTRKGAVRARVGDLGIIPGSMGVKSYIVRGKGCEEAFSSCSHGAGRKMSRSAAAKEITLEMHAADTAGVECRKDAGVIDESPRAYKDIDAVMEAQKDLVEIVHTLKQVVCVKG